MSHIAPLAAGIPINPEIIFAIFAVVVFFISSIGKLISSASNPGNNMPRRNVPPPAGGAPAQPQGQDPLRSEIEEFLRRVSNRQPGQQPPQQPGQQPGQQRPPQPRPGQARQPQQQRPGQPQRPAPPQPAKRYVPPQGAGRKRQPPVIVATAAAPPVEDEPTRRDSIEEHVKKFLGPQLKSDPLSSIDRQEKQFDQQVQQMFAHEVGHLKPAANAETPERMQRKVAAQILSAADIRTAIVLNEILQRPEHRW